LSNPGVLLRNIDLYEVMFGFWQTHCRNLKDIIGIQEDSIMLIGYARTSTLEQKAGLEAQRESLTALGCERIHEEQTSSVGLRESLRAAIEVVGGGWPYGADSLTTTTLTSLRG
jgi:hypothetical protein